MSLVGQEFNRTMVLHDLKLLADFCLDVVVVWVNLPQQRLKGVNTCKREFISGGEVHGIQDQNNVIRPTRP